MISRLVSLTLPIGVLGQERDVVDTDVEKRSETMRWSFWWKYFIGRYWDVGKN
jgi:hypothetical protein